MHVKSVNLKILLVGICLFISIVGHAQRFSQGDKLIIPDSLNAIRIDAADFDNDGLPDVVAFVTSIKGNALVAFVKGDTISPRQLSAQFVKVPNINAYMIYDYDNDNQLDILLSGADATSKAVVIRNKGDFFFEELVTNLPAFSLAKFADMDGDGSDECVIAYSSNGSKRIGTFSKGSNQEWVLTADTLVVDAMAVELADFDNDGNTDIFFSGRFSADSIASVLLIAQDSSFRIIRKSEAIGRSVIGDRDHDGLIEIVLYGTNGTGQKILQTFSAISEFAPQIQTNILADIFIADLNSDGFADINKLSETDVASRENVIDFAGQTSEQIPQLHLDHQKWIDLDQDGDLDLVQLLHNTDFEISFLENSTAVKNLAPLKSSLALAVPVHDRTLIFWTKSSDDHTSSAAITYDLLIDGKDMVHPANFDLTNGKRLVAAPGNNGSATFKLIKSNSTQINWAVQSVDNSLFGGPASICMGSGVGCVQTQLEKISACSNQSVQLQTSAGSYWFSFADGFIGMGEAITMTPHESDTVFSFIPSASGCSIVKLYDINVNDEEHTDSEQLIYACENSQIQLSVPEGWQTYKCTDSSGTSAGTGNSISYNLAKDATVTAEYSNPGQCESRKVFQLKVSVPLANVSPSEYHIMRGQSAQLNATGGVSYQWTPTNGLSRTDIANPVASPLQDTQYTVVVTDSVGCAASASVTVFVESTGFIPSLFTPNSDGQNDLLKVYGVSAVNGFKLRIFNREGNVVYKTENVNEALQSGWDGKSNGVDQPNGVYFWKVEGSSGTGKRLLLNGKNEGSIVLLR